MACGAHGMASPWARTRTAADQDGRRPPAPPRALCAERPGWRAVLTRRRASHGAGPL